MVASFLAPFFLAAFLQDAPLDDASPTLLIKAERLIVSPGEELENVTVLVDQGRIVQIGKDVESPTDARTLEGKVVCAGFIDSWSTLGLEPVSVGEARANAATRSADAVDRFRTQDAREEALRGGVTAVRAQAAAQAAIGGTGTLLRTHGGESLHDVVCLSATVGITRGGRASEIFSRIDEVGRLSAQLAKGKSYDAEQREYRFALEEWEKAIAEKVEKLEKDFKKAKKARDKKVKEAEEKDKEHKDEKYKEDKKPRAPKYSADSEVLAKVVRGEIPLIVEIHRYPELKALLAAMKAYPNVRVVLAGATEAGPLANDIAAQSISVIVWPGLLGDSRADEWADHSLSLAATLAKSGVDVMIGSRGTANVRDLRMLASTAIGYGLDKDKALAAITSVPARVLNSKGRLGTIRQGADADLILCDGDPLDTTARVRYVIAGGDVVVEP